MAQAEHKPTLAELKRYAEATRVAGDPGTTMDTLTVRFTAMAALRDEGDYTGVSEAARAIGDGCLRLCVVPADSERGAGDKVRFLTILSKWAWPRHPALAAVMDAAIKAERRTWGDHILL